MKALKISCCLIFALCIPNLVIAGPWLLPPKTLVLTGSYDYTQAAEEFLATNGRRVPFSLRGRYLSNSYTLGARFGLSDALELELRLPFRQVSYRSDPFLLVPNEEEGPGSFDAYQDKIISFNQSISGLSDLSLALRIKLLSGTLASSLELGLQTPTGYRAPSGTFGDKPKSVSEFIERSGELARPENVRDDITLGDGAFAFRPLLHLGYGHSSGFFLRGASGVSLRLQGAGPLFIGEFKAGQLVKPWLLVYAGLYYEQTLMSGRVIGVSVTATDPTLPASEYRGLDNLEPIEVTLDRDQLQSPVGLLFRPLDGAELIFSYSPVIWGRNVAASHTVSVALNLIRPY